MGHLVNPLSFRLYNTKYWTSIWFTKNQEAYLHIHDILVKKFIQKLVFTFFNKTSGILFSHIKLLRSSNKVHAYIFLHDSFLDIVLHHLQKNKRLSRFKRFILRRNTRKFNGKKIRNMSKIILRQIRMLLLYYIRSKFIGKFWTFFKQSCSAFLNKITPVSNLFKFYVVGLSKNNINASMIGQFFNVRLKQYYTIWEIFRSINFYFKTLIHKKKIINGYKISFSGRFSRKQRTSYGWKNFGTLNTSSTKSNLDYTNIVIPLRYSLCSLKIWIALNKKKRKSIKFLV